MDKLINKAAAHGHEIRKGKAIDMDKFLQDMDQMYIIDLQTTANCFADPDDAWMESLNDYKRVEAELETLKLLGYIDADEFKALLETALEMRGTYVKNRVTENKED